jgi:hypothetical protein
VKRILIDGRTADSVLNRRGFCREFVGYERFTKSRDRDRLLFVRARRARHLRTA